MARARWKAREDAPETDSARHDPGARHRLGQGRRGQVVGHGQPGRGPGPPGPDGRDPRRRHLGLLRAAAARHGGRRRGPRRARWSRSSGASAPGTLRVLSMGFLADEEQAIMWRGLVLNRAVQQFLQDAHWGDLDYLLIDLPPGTGDIQMGLARLLPRTELLVVTTPPVAAQKVAARAADMARRGYLRVAGVIENMSDFTCEHGTTYALFGSGGGERLAARASACRWSAPSRCTPIWPRPATRACRSPGRRRERARPTSSPRWPASIAEDVAPLVEAEGCTARLRRAGGGGGGPRRGRGGLRRGAGRVRLGSVLRRRPSGSRCVSSPSARRRARTARPSWPSARRWAHSEKRATGSWRSVTSP